MSMLRKRILGAAGTLAARCGRAADAFLAKEAPPPPSTHLLAKRVAELEALLAPPTWSEQATGKAVCSDANRRARVAGTTPELSALLFSLVQIVESQGTRVTMLRNALDRDRTGLARALVEVLAAARASMWIVEGRAAGGYAWNEDGYQEETGRTLGRIINIAQGALSHSGTIATRAIQDQPPPPEGPLPVAEGVEVLRLDDARLTAVLAKHWPEIRSTSTSGLAPYWKAMGAEEQAAFLRVGRIVLHAAQAVSGPGPAPSSPTTHPVS